MSATLVESRVFPYEIPRNAQQPSYPPILLPAIPRPLDPSAVQLAPLASQHHVSEYNRHKFGAKGCPIPYLPLSVQLPEYFDELRRRQIQASQLKSWWPSQKADTPPAIILGPGGAQAQDTISLQQEIEAAISEPIDNKLLEARNHVAHDQRLLHPSIKTSSTHPINISSMIPSELVPLISSHLLLVSPPTRHPAPTVFELPRSFTLDHLISFHPIQNKTQGSNIPTTFPANQTLVGNLKNRSSVAEALHAALNGKLSVVSSNKEPKKTQHNVPVMPPPTVPERSASTGTLPSPTLATLRSNMSTISLSLSLTIAGPSVASNAPSIAMNNPGEPANTAHPTTLNSGNKTHQKNENEIQPAFLPLSSISWPFRNALPPPPPPLPFLMGNLFLSSCPGKKVRLQGPIKGRSGVCRDLDTDLKRMKELGVGCIICCLDDDELEFLGAPWPEYEDLARRNGIDVLRLPTPEGLAPLTPASIDAHLTRLIDAYTMHGIPMLVHCRGGVGRAGVIACCWIIKLGLCGWVVSEQEPPLTPPLFPSLSSTGAEPPLPKTDEASDNTHAGAPRIDTLRFVERVIAVVRRRRSLKAVETYEQVKFLIDFVEYLRDRV